MSAKDAISSWDIGDVNAQRQAILERVQQALSEIGPIPLANHRAVIRDISYDGPTQFSKEEQKQAILSESTLGCRLRGTIEFYDPKTNELVQRQRVTLARVPYLTDRGTFIFQGNDYTLAKQMRLRPGVYVRRRPKGDLEAHVSVLEGRSHRYSLDPKTGIFYIEADHTSAPLLPVLQAFGLREPDLWNLFGRELYDINLRATATPARLTRLVKKFSNSPEATKDPANFLRAHLSKMKLDPEISQRTLGAPYAQLDRQALSAIVSKLLRVSLGEAEPDDKDTLANQRVVWPEQFLTERLRRSGLIQLRHHLNRASFRRQLKIPSNVLDECLWGAILDSGLGNPLEESNPLDVLDQWYRITHLGQGGIEEIEAIPDASRMVHPTHLGYIDLIHTPESETVGVDKRLAFGLRRDAQGRIFTRYVDAQGQEHWLSPAEVEQLPILFPQSNKTQTVPVARQGRQIIPVPKPPPKSVQLQSMAQAFGPLANLVPLKANCFPQRISMGARQLAQALPLLSPEAPYVQSLVPGDTRSFEQLLGDWLGAIHSPVTGTVTEVTPGYIKLDDERGKSQIVDLYDNHFLNRRTLLHNKPVVQVGQTVKRGDLLAQSNFTDATGTAALGINARVGFMVWRGKNYEDAIVVSESFAKRMVSEHAYQHVMPVEEDTVIDKNRFISIFPGRCDRSILMNYAADGVIEPGSRVKPGQPLILAARQTQATATAGRRALSWVDASLKWDHASEGTVISVHRGPRFIKVVVRTEEPLAVGDKIVNRFGNKGVVSEVVPDDQMPQDAEGRPLEVLLNPLGLISRGNVGQILEAVLGKIAERRGRPCKVADFETAEDMRQWVEEEAQRHGVSPTETVYDPFLTRQLPNVFVGRMYFLKLLHTAESKLKARAAEKYSAEDTPIKGGAAGAKRLGMMEVGALLSHGAFHTLRDASLIRGQRNDEYWQRVMSGYNPPEPHVPLIYQKWLASLEASGIHPVRRGTTLRLMPLTSTEIDKLAGTRQLQNVELVDWKSKTLEPIPGGLFDKRLTGGHRDTGRWSYLELMEPMPNPVMENAILQLLGWSRKKFLDVLAGKEEVVIGGQTFRGPKALQAALGNINVPKEIELTSQTVVQSSGDARDAAIRKLRILRALERNGQHPREWLWKKVPVLPPAFRPVGNSPAIPGTMLISDINRLYQDLFYLDQAQRKLQNQTADLSEERLAVYNALKAIAGLGEPVVPTTAKREVRGLLKQIFGDRPKFSVIQRQLIGSLVDLVGRGTIVPDPALDMDEVGLPLEKALTIYRPFVVRRLVRAGWPKLAAVRAVLERKAEAIRALEAEIKERPVLVNRAPTLHRYGIMAMRPVLVPGHAVRIPPAVTQGFGADFDGDAVQFHVPASAEAVKEAFDRLLPSKNLISPATMEAHQMPTQEFQAGLYLASIRQKPQTPRVFPNAEEVMAAFRRGELELGQPVVVTSIRR